MFAPVLPYNVDMSKEDHQITYLTTKQAGEILGIGDQRVRELIHADRLPAVKFAGVWMIKKSDLALVRDRKPGRPKKV